MAGSRRVLSDAYFSLAEAVLQQAVRDYRKPRNRGEVLAFLDGPQGEVVCGVVGVAPGAVRRKLAGVSA